MASFRNNRNRGYGNRGYNRGFYGQGYGGYGRQARLWPTVLVVIAIVGVVVFMKHQGILGHEKNKVPSSPQEQVAKVNQGIAQVTQANKNLAKNDQYNNGDLDARDDMIDNKILLKDQFSNVQDMYSFGKVYAVFVFSNSKADVPWLKEIEQARKDGLKVMTLYGKDVSEEQSPIVYNMFTRNHTVSKKSKEYNKQTGKDYPFIMLFQGGKITTVVTKQSDEKKLFDIQAKAQKKVDEKANNYEMPDNGIGIPYPDWKKYINDAGNAAKTVYSNVKDNFGNSSSK